MKTMIDVDDDVLERAARELGTRTKRETVNAALAYVAERQDRVASILAAEYRFGSPDLADPDVMAGARR